MLPKYLLLPLLYLSTPSICVKSVTFDSQLELVPVDSQAPAEDTRFTPSGTFGLSRPHQASLTKHLSLRTVPTAIYRPRSLDVLHKARLRSLQHAQSEWEQPIWDHLEVEGPDVEDLHTLAQLARMSGNAYALPGQSNWYDVDQAWNQVSILSSTHSISDIWQSFPFGWEESDGFRGHVFLSSDNSTIVLSIKGTTLQGVTSKLDKFNDNL